MHTAVVGDGYRVGGLNMDNLYPDYSNPWYMRIVSASYVGALYDDANLTYWGDVSVSFIPTAFDLFCHSQSACHDDSSRRSRESNADVAFFDVGRNGRNKG